MTEIHSFGDKLRLARERRGLSQEEAAKSLCLNVEIINALECEQFDKLPSAVFVRGYIKNYASLLRLTVNDPSLSSGASVNSARSAAPAKPFSSRFKLVPLLKNAFLRVLNYVVVILLSVLVFIWWHERRHAVEKIDTTRSIINMSVEKIPFERVGDHGLLPVVKNNDLIRDVFPGWPL